MRSVVGSFWGGARAARGSCKLSSAALAGSMGPSAQHVLTAMGCWLTPRTPGSLAACRAGWCTAAPCWQASRGRWTTQGRCSTTWLWGQPCLQVGSVADGCGGLPCAALPHCEARRPCLSPAPACIAANPAAPCCQRSERRCSGAGRRQRPTGAVCEQRLVCSPHPHLHLHPAAGPV